MTRAWLVLLACVLVLWQPASFAIVASATVPSLAIRGWMAAVELLFAGAIAAICVAAAWALVMRQPTASPRQAGAGAVRHSKRTVALLDDAAVQRCAGN